VPVAAGYPAPAASASGPAALPGDTEAVPAAPPEPPAPPDCAHPADAWDYDTGTCGVCGAVL
jgi:hypothetical protein